MTEKFSKMFQTTLEGVLERRLEASVQTFQIIVGFKLIAVLLLEKEMSWLFVAYKKRNV